MNVLIIEDEAHAAKMLESMILSVRPDARVIAVIDSVKDSLNWFEQNRNLADLVFMDIELSDGRSFEIFNHIEIGSPVVFTTAYDQFAIEAFKVNAVHYLLKPIEERGLEEVFERQDQTSSFANGIRDRLAELATQFKSRKKNRCLVKKGGTFEFVNVPDIALAYSEQSITFLVTFDGQRHIYARTIEQLALELDGELFFQVNRAQLVNAENVLQVHPYLGQRLKLSCRTLGKLDEVLVSRQRASAFKEWLDR